MFAASKYVLATKLVNRFVKQSVHLSPGDIIKVERIGYWHVGVYIGNEEVIHFSSLNSDISSKNNKIIQTSLKQFLKGKKKLEKVKFPSPDAPVDPTDPAEDDPFESFSPNFKFYNPDHRFYSGDEVVERAKSRLGEAGYCVVRNNCEHFAIWCKTGISESKQINKLINKLFTK